MADIDPSVARDHIEMVERILAESSQRLCYGGIYFIIWGVYSGVVTALFQLVANHVIPGGWSWANLLLLLVALAFTFWRGRLDRDDQPRRSLLQREFFNVLWLCTGLAFVVNIVALNLFMGWGQAAIWSFAQIVVLGYIAVHGNRRALVCAIAVLASLVVANFAPSTVTGFVLGIGMLLGYAGFGTAELLAGD